MTVEVIGMEKMKKLYEDDLYFLEAWRVNKDPWRCDKAPFMDYFIHEGLLFRNIKLCILMYSIRGNLIRELHNGGLIEHFGDDKTQYLVEERYYCLGIPKDVKRWVEC